MNKVFTITVFFCCFTLLSYSQDKAEIKRTALDYIGRLLLWRYVENYNEAFIQILPKYGYSVNKKTKEYKGKQMTYEGQWILLAMWP